ncbi:MAG: universal stress protein [Dehalococcoidales bacterium]|nr:universal stress protein [Dehalococcoidales bacterium]
MSEKILIPLDGSKVGETALPYIEELVTKFKASTKVEVTLIQVVSLLTHYVAAGEIMTPIPYSEVELDQIKKQALAYLTEAGKSLKSKKITVNIRIEVGSAAEEIIKVADDLDVDFIAMSTHGRSGISRWAFGSVTDKVLRAGHKPVIVVRVPREKN